MNRREFLKSTSASTCLLALHGKLALGRSLFSPQVETDDAPRILKLRLQTAAPLPRMKEFYRDMLDFPVLSETSDEITFQAGDTTLTFVQTAQKSEKPAYHFAFNIPENKLLSARNWQAERTALISPQLDHLRDPAFPEDVVHFSNWNAHSVFFYDPAENLVEYIARHDLNNGAKGPFTTKDILYASEIAFVVDDVRQTAKELRQASDLDPYRGGSERFMAIGDEIGLLLVMQRGRRPFGQGKPMEVFATQAVIHGARKGTHQIAGYPHQLNVQS